MTTASETDRRVRVRFAPSPTGDLHVGAVRTALWTWLYARHTGGTFILRIEDTDRARFAEGTTEGIERSLEWLGIDWDEGPIVGGAYGPYYQSQRKERYQEAAQRLVAEGKAYRCFATPDELREMREGQQARKEPPRYDGRYRDYPVAEAEARATAGESHVVRFKMPLDGSTSFTDLLRGEITFENKELDDFVILKSDGFPTYHLAHVVDDTAMEISHVTRAEEWIPSTPRHVQLFRALGYDEPIWIHYPVILGPDGGKLSKRHGAKFVLEYASEGYLPDALLNFLAITGWALDDHTEIFSRERLIEVFELGNLSKNPSGFDQTKLEWMNGIYLREMAEDQLVEVFRRRLEQALPPDIARPLDHSLIEAFTPHVRERLKLLTELVPLVEFFFRSDIPTPANEAFLTKKWKDRGGDAAAALGTVLKFLEPVDDWTTEAIEGALRTAAEELDVRAGDLFSLIRVAITGTPISPPLFESMEIVGKGLSVERIEAAAEQLGRA
ncbi:MAG: glutamate--tRNA ligase [Chloroflexi bacterium]|nr:glutamate--tRNA ligase [Chloroflexota bacterium]MDA1147979.1 glutamate--tRNA ligase [Chloroflexota bacterium]MQC82556.1 glutamate--tRNA ligase [Chloroflexota bacterium]